MSPANTADKLKSIFAPATRVEGLTGNSDWITSTHDCEEVMIRRGSKTKLFRDYIKDSEFETTKVFEHENNSVTRLTENITLTRPTEFQPLTRSAKNIPLTRPTQFEPLTGPT